MSATKKEIKKEDWNNLDYRGTYYLEFENCKEKNGEYGITIGKRGKKVFVGMSEGAGIQLLEFPIDPKYNIKIYKCKEDNMILIKTINLNLKEIKEEDLDKLKHGNLYYLTREGEYKVHTGIYQYRNDHFSKEFWNPNKRISYTFPLIHNDIKIYEIL